MNIRKQMIDFFNPNVLPEAESNLKKEFPETDLTELQGLYQEQKDSKMEALKQELGQYAKELKGLEEEKDQIEINLKEINKSIMSIQDKIRQVWGPHIAGAEEASINCDGIIIETKPKLNVSTDEKDQALNWLEHNGYKDVMRWDVNTNKMYAIARELYKDGNGEKIPGLEYKYFQLIKVR